MSLASGGSLKKELSQAEKSVHISCHRFHLDGYDMSWRTVLSEVNFCWGHLSRKIGSLREATLPLALIRQGHWAQPHLAYGTSMSRRISTWLGTVSWSK